MLIDKSIIKISFIVPIYNQQDLLPRCVDSLRNQSLTEIEIILIDDGSTDSSPLLCAEYVKKDARIKFLSSEHIGVSSVRNLGIKVAKGEYLGFVDNDDFIHLRFAEKLWQETSGGSAVMVCCGVQKLFADNGVSQFYYPENLIADNFIGQNPNILNPVWNKIFKTRYVHSFQVLFPDNSYFAEDYAFVVMYFLVTRNLGKIAFVNEALYFYWRHSASTMSNIHVNLSKKIHNSMENVEALLKFVQLHELAKNDNALVQKIILEYMWITLPILMVHNSMLRNYVSRREFHYVMRTYFYYQRKYQIFLTAPLRKVRLKFLLIVNFTRCYAPIWRQMTNIKNKINFQKR